MEVNSFEEVIDFAISREKEAVQFYVDLQKIAKFSVQKEVLKEFELMEHGHVSLLQKVKAEHSIEVLGEAVPGDLKLHDYLVEHLPVPDMNYQDIIIIGIKREEKAAKLYKHLYAESEDKSFKSAFLQLMKEEQKHKSYFEELYNEDIQGDN